MSLLQLKSCKKLVGTIRDTRVYIQKVKLHFFRKHLSTIVLGLLERLPLVTFYYLSVVQSK